MVGFFGVADKKIKIVKGYVLEAHASLCLSGGGGRDRIGTNGTSK